MCGITGFYSPSSKLQQEDLQQMTDCLTHRGPDAANYFFEAKIEGNIALGHRRLSIIDLSEAANQPFYSKDGRYVMVFNGEIYNYQNIAQQLQLSCSTTSDSEVIIEAFAKIGAAAIELLNGMFAIVIFDKMANRLHFFRDRLGIKPLYYWWNRHDLIFASEIKALKAVVKRWQVDKTAVSSFLYLGYVPCPNTFFQNVYQIPAGNSAVFENGELHISPYWQLNQQIESQVIQNEIAAKEELKSLLQSSVEYRLIADVPIGTFLSGGIDSSLVTAIAQSITDKPVKTFSIGFKESKFNESDHARKVAKHLKTEHHEFILSEQEALDQIESLLDIYDQPFADSSAVPTLLVSQMARKHVTVALSGDGGDELFMGYGMYNWAKRLANPLLRSFRKPIAQLLQQSPQNRHKRAALVFAASNKKRLKSHIFSQEQYLFSEEEIANLLTPSFKSAAFSFNEQFDDLARSLSAEEQQALFDLHFYLPDDLLTKVDRASMLHSLEVRVPLLDHRIVNFALNLDSTLKTNNGVSKYLLKKVLYDYVPAAYFDRPKWGFSIPLAHWLKNDLHYLIDAYLSDSLVGSLGVVEVGVVRKLKWDFLKGKDYLFNRIWVLILLHKFLSK
ncbi:MAG: asparagine synthase (glutamine-hydrolyzing) [Chitinophagales bacterium]